MQQVLSSHPSADMVSAERSSSKINPPACSLPYLRSLVSDSVASANHLLCGRDSLPRHQVAQNFLVTAKEFEFDPSLLGQCLVESYIIGPPRNAKRTEIRKMCLTHRFPGLLTRLHRARGLSPGLGVSTENNTLGASQADSRAPKQGSHKPHR